MSFPCHLVACNAITRQLMAIPKKEFSDCFEKWKERWDKCVRSQGEYFEGD
jgi:hypothetical protein